LGTCWTDCSQCSMPLLGSSIHARCQNTLLHYFENYTGYASWSASSSSCVFWHITVCMAQHQRIWQTSEVVASRRIRSVDSPTLLVPSARPATLGDCAFPVTAARAWNRLPAQTTTASSSTTFWRQTKTYLFCQSFR